MKKGIIFDLDGTLWDSAAEVVKSWNELLREEKEELRKITIEDIQSVMGRTMAEIADMIFPMLSHDKAMNLMHRCCDRENDYLKIHGGTLYPHVETTFQQMAKKYPLYIVSNCQAGYIEAFLAYYDFGKYIEDIECYGNNGLNKADNIALVVKRNQLEEAVYVGDIQGDYDSSCKAGIKFIHAAYGFGTITQNVPAIRDLEELPKTVESIF